MESLGPGDASVNGAVQTGGPAGSRPCCLCQGAEQMWPCPWVPRWKKSREVLEIMPEVSAEITLPPTERHLRASNDVFQEVRPDGAAHWRFSITVSSACTSALAWNGFMCTSYYVAGGLFPVPSAAAARGGARGCQPPPEGLLALTAPCAGHVGPGRGWVETVAQVGAAESGFAHASVGPARAVLSAGKEHALWVLSPAAP